MIEVRDRRVIVVGTGKSGIGSAVLLEKNGALPILYDGNEKADIDAVKTLMRERLGHDTKAEFHIGAFQDEITEGVELAVLSPGVPVDADFVVYMKTQGIHIWGEIELGYHYAKGRVLAITGTNGKTTTVSLINFLLLGENRRTYLGGNIGTPVTSFASCTKKKILWC